MLTNYTINQPFTSDFSVEEGEKNSSRTWNHRTGRIVNHVETFFYAEARKVSGRKTIQSQHCESQFVPGWTEFFLGPFKESRFPLFGISIQAGKRSSRKLPFTFALEASLLGQMFIFRTISQPRTLSADIPAAWRGLFTKWLWRKFVQKASESC